MREAEEWWGKARKDLETADYNLKGNMLDAAAFFAQQAAEKALKSLQIKSSGSLKRFMISFYSLRALMRLGKLSDFRR